MSIYIPLFQSSYFDVNGFLLLLLLLPQDVHIADVHLNQTITKQNQKAFPFFFEIICIDKIISTVLFVKFFFRIEQLIQDRSAFLQTFRRKDFFL